MSMYKSKIPLTIVSILFIFVVISFFFEVPEFYSNINIDVQNFSSIIAAFAMLISSLNIIRVNGTKIIKKKTNWEYSMALLLVFIITIIAGLIGGSSGFQFQWINKYIQTPVGASIYALNGFFIITAMYRAFRMGTWESVVLLICGFIIIFQGSPIGSSILPSSTIIGDWLTRVGMAAGFRGWFIATAISTVIMGLDVFFQRISIFGASTEEVEEI